MIIYIYLYKYKDMRVNMEDKELVECLMKMRGTIPFNCGD